jgi:riboflavin biosynthesis pyrimidine reductase
LNPVEALQRLFEAAAPDAPEVPLPEALRTLYGGPLAISEELVYSNFVTSLDGVAALPGAGVSSGPALSGRSEADRFVMGLLRAVADCVLVGAQTLRDDAGHLWTPDYIYPPGAAGFAALRAGLGLSAEPALCVLTRSGDLDRSQRVFREQQPLVLEGDLALGDVLRDLGGRGWRRVLCEGGPVVIGELVRDGLLEEAFITLSPVLAGRGTTPRPGMVGGVELLPERGVWGRLAGVRRHQDHLFLRYRLR